MVWLIFNKWCRRIRSKIIEIILKYKKLFNYESHIFSLIFEKIYKVGIDFETLIKVTSFKNWLTCWCIVAFKNEFHNIIAIKIYSRDWKWSQW